MQILITSVLAFISTNIDDLFLLMLFYANSRYRSRQIIIGQLVGIIVLVAISLVISFIGFVLDQSYIGLFGLFPIYLGVKEVIELFKDNDDNPEVVDINNLAQSRKNITAVAGVTIANGGDNVGIYIPLFATLNGQGKSIMIAVFLIMTLMLCWVAQYLTRHRYVAKLIEKFGHVITPFILIALGIFILYENKSIEIFNGLFRN